MRALIFRIAVVLLSIVGFVLTGCGSPGTTSPQRHIILIVIDTMRGDYLGSAGGPVATPNLDQLAADGVRFTQARATAPITGPSHASIFTGLFPNQHGVTNNGHLLDDEFLTMAEIAKANGRATTAFVSLGVLKGAFGYDQGFDSYDHNLGLSWWRNAAEVNAEVFPWLVSSQKSEIPQFLWIHYSDPHVPYAAPGRPFPAVEFGNSATDQWQSIEANGSASRITTELHRGKATLQIRMKDEQRPPDKGFVLHFLDGEPDGIELTAGKRVRQRRRKRPTYFLRPPAALKISSPDREATSASIGFVLTEKLSHKRALEEYGAEVEFVDQEIGELIRRLKKQGWYDNSLIVVTGDHGEGLGDHGIPGHVHQLYDSLLHVPLLVVAPGMVPAGVVVEDPVSTLDILPTIADLAAFGSLERQRGQSLLPLMHGGQIERNPLYAITAKPQAKNDLDAVVDDGFKVIRNRNNDHYELYDLAADPGELQDRAAEHKDVLERIVRLLEEIASEETREGVWLKMDDDSRRKLEALGYIQ